MSQDQFSKDINFPKVVFLHINRVLTSVGSPEMFCSCVEGLEDVLFPYLDTDYEKNCKKSLNTQSFVSGALDVLSKDKSSLMANRKVEVSRKKFRALMCVAEKKNLLLEKTDDKETWNLDDEDANT